MNLENVVYSFAVQLRDAATSGDALYEAIVHADTYEEMNAEGGTKFIRIDNLMGSVPQPAGSGAMQEFNALLDVQFLQIPQKQELSDRLAARTTTNQMALDFISGVFADRTLGTNDCEVVKIATARKLGDWVKVGNVKTPRAIVRLLINPDENIR